MKTTLLAVLVLCLQITSAQVPEPGGFGGGASASQPRVVERLVASNTGGGCVSGPQLPASSGPSASCDSDGKAVLAFAAGQTTNTTSLESVQMPSTLTGLTFKLSSRVSSSSGNVSGNQVWRVSYTCNAAGASSVPTLSSTADATVTITASPANGRYEATATLNTAGCAGNRLHYAISLVSLTTSAAQLIDNAVITATP